MEALHLHGARGQRQQRRLVRARDACHQARQHGGRAHDDVRSGAAVKHGAHGVGVGVRDAVRAHHACAGKEGRRGVAWCA
jgi:hypothetical protein